MRNVSFALILEYIINTFDVKRIDSPGYWPNKETICVDTHHTLRAWGLRFNIFLRTTCFKLAVKSLNNRFASILLAAYKSGLVVYLGGMYSGGNDVCDVTPSFS